MHFVDILLTIMLASSIYRYLVSVYRASTGNIHRAVGPDFVLNVGDILYFTGMVEGFRTFCEENGLEIITKDKT